MATSLAFRVTAAIVFTLVMGCNESTAPTPPPAPPPPPPPAPSDLWSDPATWPDGIVPAAGAAVTIPAGKTVLLDVSPPPLTSLTVLGTLRLQPADLNLTAGWIAVTGRFEVGSEAVPFTNRVVITLNGPTTDDIMGMGYRVFGAINGGVIELHGQKRVGWTRLAATAPAGATQLTLEREVDWRPGDQVVIASVFRSSLPEGERLSEAELVSDLAAAGVAARHLPGVDEIVGAIAAEAREGDLVVVMSNGGFGGATLASRARRRLDRRRAPVRRSDGAVRARGARASTFPSPSVRRWRPSIPR